MRATMHDPVDEAKQRHRVADLERRRRVDQHVVVVLGERSQQRAPSPRAPSSAGGLSTSPPLSSTDTEPAPSVWTAVETPPSAAAASAGGARPGSGFTVCIASRSATVPVSTSASPFGRVDVEQPGLDWAAEVRLDDRDALAGVALHAREVGDQRRAAVAGVGAHEQDRARSRSPAALAQRRRGLAARCAAAAAARAAARAGARVRRRVARPAMLTFGSAVRICVWKTSSTSAERAQPPVEAAQHVGGHRGEEQAEDEAEDRVLFRRRRDRQRARLGGT